MIIPILKRKNVIIVRYFQAPPYSEFCARRSGWGPHHDDDLIPWRFTFSISSISSKFIKNLLKIKKNWKYFGYQVWISFKQIHYLLRSICNMGNMDISNWIEMIFKSQGNWDGKRRVWKKLIHPINLPSGIYLVANARLRSSFWSIYVDFAYIRCHSHDIPTALGLQNF